ncbi:MAG TPA: hypothetical protein VI141_04065 [Acidimicrobiia bacterium]
MRYVLLFVALSMFTVSCAAQSAESSTTSSVVNTTSTQAATTTTRAITTTAEPTTTTLAVTTLPSLPVFPAEAASLEHGGDIWAVVLAGSDDFDDPGFVAAQAAADEAGYTTGPTDCDLGAAEALGLPDGTYTISVYFDTEAIAEQARAAFEARSVPGVVALVQTFCMD